MKNAISSSQLRAARGLLNWSREDLAAKAKASARTIARIEDGDVQVPHADTVNAITLAFVRAGVVFIPENGGGAGVRLKRKRR